MLTGKNIVVGVTGGIAVYKVVQVVSDLVKLNANVHVIMTKNATEFVTPLTFQSISNNRVVVDMFESPVFWEIEHIALAKKADLFLVAPATANFIGKLNSGIADDMLTTTVMATTSKVIIAPAMNVNMYNNPMTTRNIESLKDLGYEFIEPESGVLACGDKGIGRLQNPKKIVEHILMTLLKTDELKGKKVLVTAGATKESIDPVRFITNRSSGKMGYAIAKVAALKGADVVLISGTRHIEKPALVDVIYIDSAQQMYEAVMQNLDSDIIIKAAAVADYRPKDISLIKIKKSDDDMNIALERNKDILYELGKIKTNQYLVGFAAETNNVLENAKQKIQKKNLNLIVANDVTEDGAGFNSNTNIVTFLNKNGIVKTLPLMTKEEVAFELFDTIISDMD